MLANQGGLEPFFDQPLARPRDRADTGLPPRRDLAVAPALTTVRGVGFQQDPGLQQLLCWMVSAMDQGGEMLSLLIAQCHYVFLYRDLFPGHQSAPSAATEPSSQTNTAESMTGTTSRLAGGAARRLLGCRCGGRCCRLCPPATKPNLLGELRTLLGIVCSRRRVVRWQLPPRLVLGDRQPGPGLHID